MYRGSDYMASIKSLEEKPFDFGYITAQFYKDYVIIGKENLYRQLENSSVIVAKYSVGGSDSGTIGLIGPTRMDYENIIPSIKYLTDIVGRMITQAIEE